MATLPTGQKAFGLSHIHDSSHNYTHLTRLFIQEGTDVIFDTHMGLFEIN